MHIQHAFRKIGIPDIHEITDEKKCAEKEKQEPFFEYQFTLHGVYPSVVTSVKNSGLTILAAPVGQLYTQPINA